jgi:hypothetical protein
MRELGIQPSDSGYLAGQLLEQFTVTKSRKGGSAALRVQDPDALLKSSRPAGIAAWRKEERLLALGAWLHGR